MDTQTLPMTSNPHGPLSTKEVLDQVQAIQQIMAVVMKTNEHYGIIPGTKKPTLYKAGAEKLMLTFRFAPDYEITPLFPGDDDKIGYRVLCRITSITTGKFLGAGVGECSTEEEKYKWKKAVSEAEYEATDPADVRLKYYANGDVVKQVRTNPHDLANTVLKMANKRGLVDSILTVCAASDIFTQDLEEMAQNVPTPENGQNAAQLETPPLLEDTWTPTNHGCRLTEFQPKGGTVKTNWLTFGVQGSTLKLSAYHLPEAWSAEDLTNCVTQQQPVQFQFKINRKEGKEYFNLTKLRFYTPLQEDRVPEPEAPQEYTLKG